MLLVDDSTIVLLGRLLHYARVKLWNGEPMIVKSAAAPVTCSWYCECISRMQATIQPCVSPALCQPRLDRASEAVFEKTNLRPQPGHNFCSCSHLLGRMVSNAQATTAPVGSLT